MRGKSDYKSTDTKKVHRPSRTLRIESFKVLLCYFFGMQFQQIIYFFKQSKCVCQNDHHLQRIRRNVSLIIWKCKRRHFALVPPLPPMNLVNFQHIKNRTNHNCDYSHDNVHTRKIDQLIKKTNHISRFISQNRHIEKMQSDGTKRYQVLSQASKPN